MTCINSCRRLMKFTPVDCSKKKRWSTGRTKWTQTKCRKTGKNTSNISTQIRINTTKWQAKSNYLKVQLMWGRSTSSPKILSVPFSRNWATCWGWISNISIKWKQPIKPWLNCAISSQIWTRSRASKLKK